MKIKKRLTLEEAKELIKRNLKIDGLGTLGARAILENVIPFSWERYCRENKINTNMLMDKHEKDCRRREKEEDLKE